MNIEQLDRINKFLHEHNNSFNQVNDCIYSYHFGIEGREATLLASDLQALFDVAETILEANSEYMAALKRRENGNVAIDKAYFKIINSIV